MNFNWKIIRKKLYGILKSPGRDVKSVVMYDERGNETVDPVNANRYFIALKSFDPKIDSFKILVAVRDEGQQSHIDFKTPNLDNASDFDHIYDMINHVRSAIGRREGIKINWQQFDKEIDPREEVMHNIQESKDVGKLSGTTKSSFQQIGNARLIVRHTDSINEEKHGARTRHIKSLFIENKIGERFSYPHLHMTGARAFARHISNGGTNYDNVANGIYALSEDYLSLRRVCKEMKIHENTNSYLTTLRNCMESINRKLKSMHGPKGYKSISTELIKENVITDMAAIEKLQQQLAETCMCATDSSNYDDFGVAARYINQQPIDVPVEVAPMDFSWSRTPNFSTAAYDNPNLKLYHQVKELADSCANPAAAEQLHKVADQLLSNQTLSETDIKLCKAAINSSEQYIQNIKNGIVQHVASEKIQEEVELDSFLNEFELENMFAEEELDEISKDLAGSYMKGVASEPSDKAGKPGRITGMQQASQKIHGHEVDGKKVLVPATEEEEVEEGFWDNLKQAGKEFWYGTDQENIEKEATKRAHERYLQNPAAFKDKPVNWPADDEVKEDISRLSKLAGI